MGVDVFASEVNSAAPEWVEIFPAGVVMGKDGRGPFCVRDPAKVIEKTRAYHGRADVSVDYDHQALFVRTNGKPAIASGWIDSIEERSGALWGHVKWTAAAAQRIEGKEYRYVSPLFEHAPNGDVIRIHNVALTNTPNFDFDALQAAAAFCFSKESEPMEEFLKALRAVLGLPETAKEAEVTACCQSLVAGVGAVAAALGAKGTPVEQISAASAELPGKLALATGTPDPSQWVPMSQFMSVSAELVTLQKKAVTDAVDAVIAEGKIAPAQKEWALGYASSDFSGFTAFAASAPVLLAPASQGLNAPPSTNGGLDETEKMICLTLGLTPEAYKAAKE